MDDQLSRYRQSIDNIDAALVYMLAERFKVTKAVGELKATIDLPPADPDRVGLGHQAVEDPEDEVLYRRVGQVQHQLMAIIMFGAVGQADDPFRMALIQVALRIHHLGFNPDAEAQLTLLGLCDQIADAVG